MSKLQLRIVLPSREAVSQEADSVNLTAFEGEVGILPGHAALLAGLKPGPASIKEGGTVEKWALGEGFLEVHDDTVTALVQTAERASEIDVDRARRRKAELEEQIRAGKLGEFELRRAEISLMKQVARLAVAGAHE